MAHAAQGIDEFLLRATLPLLINFTAMELTKEYFDGKLSQLVTKEDAKAFATKDDLLEFPTKNDLAAARADITEIKELVQSIDERDDQDTRAVLRDIVDLNRRVSALERPAIPH